MRISDWSSDVCSSDLWLPSNAASSRCGGHRAEPDRAHPCRTRLQGRADRLRPDRNLRHRQPLRRQIGRESCRERVCQYVYISVVAVSLKKKNKTKSSLITNDINISIKISIRIN